MVCSCFRLSSRVCDGEFISCVLFRYSVLSVQMFSPFRSDVHSVLFRCSVLSVQMFSPSRSDVHSVLFRCSVRSVQMFSPFCSDVQYVLLRCPVCHVTSRHVLQLPRLSSCYWPTDWQLTTSPCSPLPVDTSTEDGPAAVSLHSLTYTHTALCDLFSSQQCTSLCECQQ